MAKALAYAHAQGVVHRDVKPDNVMLSGGTAVVTDFGIAKAVSVARGDAGGTALTQSGVGIGTPAYMAPEQVVGDPTTDHRSDIYSFGCLAYELFVGTPPFEGGSPYQVISAHMRTTPKRISETRTDVPEAISQLVQRCLAKDPAARPQQASELLDALAMAPTAGADAVPARRPLSGRAMALIGVGAWRLPGRCSLRHRPLRIPVPPHRRRTRSACCRWRTGREIPRRRTSPPAWPKTSRGASRPR